MPVPTLITELSQTAASNSPAGTESPITADNYFRAISGFVAELRDGVGFAAPVTLASATTTSIGAQNSLAVEITGTTTITSFGTTYKGPRLLRFTGALTLTHSSSLNLPGAANITTVAGDTCIAEPNSAGNGWNVYAYQRSASLPAPIASPTFTGTATIPTLTVTNDATINGIIVGRSAGNVATNVAVGGAALDSNTVGSNNVAVGVNALTANTSGIGCVAVGSNAAAAVTTENGIVAVGYYALAAATGLGNVGIGFQSGLSIVDGTNNVALGNSSLGLDVSGSNNVAVGGAAMYATTGSNNTSIGYQAGYGAADINANTSGANNTFIGYRAVGASASTSNAITLGNSSIATLRCQVTSITALSDARDKTDVRDLSFGLDFVDSLRPVAFTWNMRDGGKVGIQSSGFIAQELQAAQQAAGATETLNLVYAENPEKLEATYGNLIPVLVKAIQELRAEVESLRSQLLS